jgi:hypothetical protein
VVDLLSTRGGSGMIRHTVREAGGLLDEDGPGTFK